MVRVISLAAALFVLVVLSVGCGWNGNSPFKASTTLLQSAPHVVATGLNVRSRNGSLDVAADPDASAVSIEASIRCGGMTQTEADDRLAATTLEITRDADNVLVIRPVFPEPARSADAASFVIRTPDAQGVRLQTSNGRIVARGLHGSLVADTSNGRVEVFGHDGSAQIDTSNGAIVVEDHHGSLAIDTSNGSITLRNVAGAIEADSSNGRIDVALADEHTGPVVLDTSNGSIRLEVGPNYAGEVVMKTSNGSIDVDDRAGRLAYTNIRRNSGTVRFHADGGRSVLDTSNSSVKLVVRASED